MPSAAKSDMPVGGRRCERVQMNLDPRWWLRRQCRLTVGFRHSPKCPAADISPLARFCSCAWWAPLSMVSLSSPETLLRRRLKRRRRYPNSAESFSARTTEFVGLSPPTPVTKPKSAISDLSAGYFAFSREERLQPKLGPIPWGPV
jgi:hypothetical protein